MGLIYTSSNTQSAYQLNWGLTVFWRQKPIPDDQWLAELKSATESDGIRILKHRFTTGDASQFFVSTKPQVAPSELIRFIKGRLQHAIRSKAPKALQRNYCLRSIGSATREVIEEYVSSQLKHHAMADPEVNERFKKFQFSDPKVDLAVPSFSSHGEYWYNLHLVFVNEERWALTDERVLDDVYQAIRGLASSNAHRISRLSLVADHTHSLMGCPIEQSPEEIALGYLNTCAAAHGNKAVFQSGYYVGTVGEYTRGAVR